MRLFKVLGTNCITISFTVLPMVSLVIPLVPMVMPMVPLTLPMVPLVSDQYTSRDSLVVRVSASGAADRGFASRSRHTKGVKNGTSSSLANAHIKG